MNVTTKMMPVAPTTEDQRLSAATRIAGQFEQMFVQQMVENFRKVDFGDGSGMFGEGPGSDTYAQWFDEHMARHMSTGRGLGINKVILQDLRRLGQIPTANEQGVDHVA